MNKEQHVLIGPGMDGRTGGIKFLTRNWKDKYGLMAETVPINWKDQEHVQEKLDRVLQTVDRYVKLGEAVKLIGCSAFASLMLVVFSKRKDVVDGLVLLDGFIRPGTEAGWRSFETRSAQSQAFRESVSICLELEPTLTTQDRKKILTVTPKYGDELVPPETVIVEGASNKKVPMGEHVLSIAFALVRYDPVIKFLKEGR